jgi:hypothetical protein
VEYNWDEAWRYAEALFKAMTGKSFQSFQFKGDVQSHKAWVVPVKEQV